MKIRLGFVSNSSSSSFIIAFKKPSEKPCPTCGHKDVSIVDLINTTNDGESEVGGIGYKEVLRYMNESYWGDSTQNEFLNVRKEMLKLKKEGYDFAELAVSYHNETLNELLNNHSGVKILWSCS